MTYLRGSVLFSIFTLIITLHYFYALDRMGAWQITPGYFLFIFYAVSIFLLIMAFKKKYTKNFLQKITLTIPILINIFLTGVLCMFLFFSMFFGRSFTLIQTETSPDEKINLDFYFFAAGGMGTFEIIGEVNGPLWFKKRIYYEKRIEDIQVIG